MGKSKFLNDRLLSVLGFSLVSTYVLSFQFEGQVLHSLFKMHQVRGSPFVLASIVAECAGLFSAGFFVKSGRAAKQTMVGASLVCFAVTAAFFFSPSFLWFAGLIAGGFASGCAVAAWGYFLRAYTPRNERIKTCADVLILSNVLMIGVNVISRKASPFLGLAFIMLTLVLGAGLIWRLKEEHPEQKQREIMAAPQTELTKSLLLLSFFVAIITINSGLMYEVINPAFEHLSELVSWYWALPYVAALLVLRNLPQKLKHSTMLYAGMIMIVAAFVGFMLLGRTALDYLVVDTLMLAACGIFDLFWWSILGELLDYTERPVRVFGIGLAANVLGILLGSLLGMVFTASKQPAAEIAVLALSVISITLVMLPYLNRQLLLLLKSHAYLQVYEGMSKSEKTAVLSKLEPIDPLTLREEEVLHLLLAGKSNREIAAGLYISENTVKTHASNIFSKYEVHSRAELISNLLKGETEESE